MPATWPLALSCKIKVRVTPRSSVNKVELIDGVLKVWVTAAPTDGQANEAVCSQVASAVGRPPSSVHVARGTTSRDKILGIEGLSEEEVWERLRRRAQ